MSLKLITAPASAPIDTAIAKAHLRVTHAEDDALIASYIAAAEAYLDGAAGTLGRALVTQTWEYALDCFPSCAIKIPLPPLQSVTSVKYIDIDGVEQTLSSARYQVDAASQPGWIVVDSDGWPETDDTANAVKIRFVAGYGTADDVPEAVRASMLLRVQALYEASPEDALRLEEAAARLAFPWRANLGV